MYILASYIFMIFIYISSLFFLFFLFFDAFLWFFVICSFYCIILSWLNRYKEELKDNFDISFSNLFTMTNMPIKRFADFLYRRKELGDYMDLLVKLCMIYITNWYQPFTQISLSFFLFLFVFFIQFTFFCVSFSFLFFLSIFLSKKLINK